MTWETHMDVWLLSDWTNDTSISRHDLIAIDHEFDYPVAVMEGNPHVKPFLDRYFGHRDSYHAISSIIFPLKQPLVDRVEAVCAGGFQRHMIGLQMRRLKGHGDYLPEVDSFTHLALAVQEARGWTDDETGFFVATDVPGVLDDVKAALPGRTVVYMEKDMKIAFQPNENPGTVIDALIDMKLLSVCDEILITYGSSFGQVAAAWGGLKPYVLLFGSRFINKQLPRMSQVRHRPEALNEMHFSLFGTYCCCGCLPQHHLIITHAWFRHVAFTVSAQADWHGSILSTLHVLSAAAAL
jgi:hypothetical protein